MIFVLVHFLEVIITLDIMNQKQFACGAALFLVSDLVETKAETETKVEIEHEHEFEQVV